MSQIVRQISWSRIKLIGHIFAPFDTKQILCKAAACLSLCDKNQMFCKNFWLCFFCRAMMYKNVLNHGFQRNFGRMCQNLLWKWTFVVDLHSGMKVGHGDRIFWQNFEVVQSVQLELLSVSTWWKSWCPKISDPRNINLDQRGKRTEALNSKKTKITSQK